MARGKFIAPTLTELKVAEGEDFMSGEAAVPPLTPQEYDPALATEELERAAVNPAAFAGLLEIDRLEAQFKLELGETA